MSSWKTIAAMFVVGLLVWACSEVPTELTFYYPQFDDHGECEESFGFGGEDPCECGGEGGGGGGGGNLMGGGGECDPMSFTEGCEEYYDMYVQAGWGPLEGCEDGGWPEEWLQVVTDSVGLSGTLTVAEQDSCNMFINAVESHYEEGSAGTFLGPSEYWGMVAVTDPECEEDCWLAGVGLRQDVSQWAEIVGSSRPVRFRLDCYP